MMNKDKRSIIMALAIADGCLHYVKNGGKIYGGLTIAHSNDQTDYLQWKAELLSVVTDRHVKIRKHPNNANQIQVSMKRMRAWRRFCYPSGIKDIPRILHFVRHPELAAAIMLMDDGYVEPSVSKLATGEKKNYGARLRLFVCEQNEKQINKIIDWFKVQLNVECKKHFQYDKRTKKHYPYLKFNSENSLKLWEIIKDLVMKFESMKYKFRYMIDIYQKRVSTAHSPSE